MEKALAPVRHPQPSLFLGDISDVAIKDDMASMEHPLFALQSGDMRPRTYKNGEVTFEIKPSPKGVPSIFDKDVLLYVISKLMAHKERGEPLQKNVVIDATEYMQFTNRSTAGRYYSQLKDSLTRLYDSALSTNIKTGEQEEENVFRIVDAYKIRRHTEDGRVVEWGVTLSDWIMRLIEKDEVLTISPDYFRLRKPLHRRIYEIARKHCGRKGRWTIGLDKLYMKSGSRVDKQRFRRQMEELASINPLPDYDMFVEDGLFVFGFRGEALASEVSPLESRQIILNTLGSDSIQYASKLFREAGVGQELTRATDDFIDYVSEREHPKSVDGAYVAFMKKWLERRNLR